jgi:hypothetical protein
MGGRWRAEKINHLSDRYLIGIKLKSDNVIFVDILEQAQGGSNNARTYY